MSRADTYPFSTTWQWKPALFWSALSALLFASWFAPGTGALWDWADEQFFYAMNATVAWGEPFAKFWAVTGDRRFDYVGALTFFGIYIYFISRGTQEEFQHGITFGIVTALLLLLIIALQREIISWPRMSPGFVLEPHHLIQEFVSWSRAKEGSNSSFPGDHATVMMILTAFWWRGVSRQLGIITAIATVFFTLPRMAAGAHWLTDATIGGGCVMLIALAVAYGTPLGWWLYKPARRLADWGLGIWQQAETRMVDPALGTVGPKRQILRGLCIGMADLVPGVSGGTMALILGIYKRLITAISHVDKEFLRLLFTGRFVAAMRHIDILFLLPLVGGIFGAIIIFSRVIPLPLLMDELPEIMFGLFFGLIAASIVDLYGRVHGTGQGLGNFAWIGLGVALGLAVVTLVPVDSPDDVWFIVLCGMVAVLALLIPGVSGAFILLILGKYAATIDALGTFDLYFLAPLALGAVIGMIIFSRAVAALLDNYYRQTMLTVTGILGGSLLAVWPFQDRHYELVGEKLRLISSTPYVPGALDWGVAMGVAAIIAGILAYRLLEKLARKTEPGT